MEKRERMPLTIARAVSGNRLAPKTSSATNASEHPYY